MKKTFINLFLSVSVILICYAGIFCQTHNAELSKVFINDFYAENISLPVALSRIASKYKMPIGIVTTGSEFTEPVKVNLNIKNSSLEDVLNSLIQQDSDYKWEERNGVINFAPKNPKIKFLEEFLNTKVFLYNPARNLDRYSIVNYIINAPSVEEFLQKNKAYGGFLSETRIVNLDLPDSVYDIKTEIDVRTLFNKIIRESNYKTWTIYYTKMEDEEVTIFIKI